jgi:type IV secretory pathway VirB4 component
MAQETPATQGILPVNRIERGCLVMKDGGLRSIVIVSGMNFELRSEEEQNVAISAYQNFLNGLDFPIQIFVHSRKINIDEYVSELATIEKKEVDPLMKELITGYRAFISSLVADNPIMEKTFFVVVPYDHALPAGQRAILDAITGFFRRNKADDPIPEADDREKNIPLKNAVPESARAALSERTEQVISGLSQIGLRAAELEENELLELFYNACNPETVERHTTAA